MSDEAPSDDENSAAAGIEVPHGDISDDALRGLAESFVLREGTDYGDQAFSLDEKVARVIAQLQRGDAAIVFNTVSGGIDIMVKHELNFEAPKPED